MVPPPAEPKERRPHPASLTAAEKDLIIETLCSERFVDLAPAQVYATLLDEGSYHCSERTMYRILAADHEVRERRDQPALLERLGWLFVSLARRTRDEGFYAQAEASANCLATYSKHASDATLLRGHVAFARHEFADALKRLSGQATHLYVDGAQYWYSLQPNVTRVAADRAASNFTDRDADDERKRRPEALPELGSAGVDRCVIHATSFLGNGRLGD